MIQKNVIKFKEDIDFNYISKFLDMNTYTSQFSGLWYEERIFQSVMQIRSVQKHPKFKKIYNYLDKQFNKYNQKGDLDIFMSWVSGTRSSTHTDPYDVFLIGAQGRTLYKTEDEEAVLEKGDIIHITKGVTHTAIGLDPRIVLSYALF